MDTKKPFLGLKVIELASVLAGPAVGSFFAELGATVIKIENPATKGDITRHWKLPAEDKASSISAYYASVNYGKKVLMLDLKLEVDLKQLYAEIADADIVISNYKPASARKLKIDYTSLKTLNPSIVYAELTGFPEGDKRAAFDVVLQAETGFMGMNGHPNSEPVKMPVALIDILAAHQLKEAILIALLRKEKTGQGSFVTASLYESAIASLANQASNYFMANHIPQPIGSLHPNIAPYGEVFITKEGDKMVLAIGTDQQFVAMCKLINATEIKDNSNYITNTNRVKNRSELANELAPYFLQLTTTELLELFHQNKIPVGKIKNLQEVFESDEAKKLVLEEDIEGKQTKRVKSVAFSMQ